MKSKRKIILIGMKSSGKTTTGRTLARKLGLRFIDMDAEIERLHGERKGEKLRFREIFAKHGKEYFRNLETAALQSLFDACEEEAVVLATGGGLPLAEDNRALLRNMGINVFLDVAEDVLLPRIVAGGIPAFFPYPDDPAKSLNEILSVRRPIYRALAQITVECRAEPAESIAVRIVEQLEK
jgi:shikimate kinase